MIDSERFASVVGDAMQNSLHTVALVDSCHMLWHAMDDELLARRAARTYAGAFSLK